MHISKRWRCPKLVLGLFIAEIPITVALLALTGIASPNTYRTKLWKDGADNGFNSAPIDIILSHANYKPVETPLVWSSAITNFNLVVSVLAMFFLLCKAIMYILHVFPPLLSFIVHALLVGLFSYSVHGQTAPDTIRRGREVNGPPWYITKSCSVTRHPSNIGYCKQAKATFAVTLVMLLVLIVNLALALWSIVPTKKQRIVKRSEIDTKDFSEDDVSPEMYQHQWEMQNMMPKAPASVAVPKNPATPRTQAFDILSSGKR